MKPKEAKIACERLTIEGLAGWRLPTSKELTRMFSVYHNQERHPFGRLGEGCYLTNTECKGWKLRCVNLQKREDNNCCDGRDDWYWPVRGSEQIIQKKSKMQFPRLSMSGLKTGMVDMISGMGWDGM